MAINEINDVEKELSTQAAYKKKQGGGGGSGRGRGKGMGGEGVHLGAAVRLPRAQNEMNQGFMSIVAFNLR